MMAQNSMIDLEAMEERLNQMPLGYSELAQIMADSRDLIAEVKHLQSENIELRQAQVDVLGNALTRWHNAMTEDITNLTDEAERNTL